MTRDEAVGWLNEIIQRSADCDRMSIDDERVQAIMVARDVLEAMAPDAETGLMPCGCGGKARIEESPFSDDVDNIGLKIYMVGCTDCIIGFEGYFTSNEDAQEHWNTAMGHADAVQGQ